MQTSLARRQRHRRLGTARRPRGSSAVRRTVIAIPFLIFGLFLSAGLAGFLGIVAAYSYYSQNLPDPKVLLTALAFDQQTTVVDRTGKYELARLGERKRLVVAFADIPPEAIDATTAI